MHTSLDLGFFAFGNKKPSSDLNPKKASHSHISNTGGSVLYNVVSVVISVEIGRLVKPGGGWVLRLIHICYIMHMYSFTTPYPRKTCPFMVQLIQSIYCLCTV